MVAVVGSVFVAPSSRAAAENATPIHSSDKSNVCLDVVGNSLREGDPVLFWPCNGQDNQLWTFDGAQLINAHSGMCLDLPWAKSAPGTRLQQAACWGGLGQQWKWSAKAIESSFENMCLTRDPNMVKDSPVVTLEYCIRDVLVQGWSSDTLTVDSTPRRSR
jgi:hypothetical protein